METLLLHIVQSSFCLSLLYLGFVCLLRNTTRFHFNRSLILWGCLVCTLLPFVRVQLKEETFVRIPIAAIHSMVQQNDVEIIQEEQQDEFSSTWIPSSSSYVMVLAACYAIGCLPVLLMIMLSRFRIRAIIRHAVCYEQDSYKLYVTPEQGDSFSWGRSIIVPKEVYDSKAEFEEVLIHELSHLRRRHSLDVLLMQWLVTVHWFNPFVWLLRRELLDIHEYQADNDVINQGINATQYQLLLVKKAVGSRLYILANGFNHSKLKKRITMMLKKRTNRMSQLRAFLFVPLVVGAVYSFATITPVSTKQDQQWAYPLPGSTLNGSYGGERKHSGIDLKAEKGAKIQAAFDGQVVSAVSSPVYGKVIVIRHDNGLETKYAHNSENLVKKGEVVKAGQVVALVGNTGLSTGPHCHFEIRKEGVLIDPETIFDTAMQSLRTK